MSAKIEFSPQASKEIERFGVELAHVVDTVKSPDSRDNIRPEQGVEGKWPVVLLYMKRLVQTNKLTLLLVQALKSGGVLTITSVWQVFPSDIGVNVNAEVRHVFDAFLNKYAIDLKTKHGIKKIVLYDVVSSSTTIKNGCIDQTFNWPEGFLRGDDFRVADKPEIGISRWSRQMSVRMYIAVMYTLNLTNYLHDLSSHGMKVA